MKNLVLIFVFLVFTTLSFAQGNEVVVSNDITIKKELNADAKTNTNKEEAVSNSVIKNQLMKLNHKKSNEIISIKAYRKSLQIKTKTVKLC